MTNGRYGRLIMAAAATMLVGACTVSEGNRNADTAAAASPAAQTPAAAPATMTDSGARSAPMAADSGRTGSAANASGGKSSALSVEVDLKARKAYLLENGQRVETHGVAVGSSKWPTQTGEWTIKQVVFNPEWIPPDESWAEEREPRKPGDPKNPLGMAQLVYDPPRTIHGTNQPSSIGTATSHGSIRMRNEEIVALAKRILAGTGAAKDEAWYRRAATERTVKQIVDLPTPVPIKVY